MYDGDDTSTATDLGRYCGNTYPAFFQSASTDLIFQLHTDPYIGAPGFEIIWAVDG